ncbi:MAG: DUF4437 domain-containing protein [Steroidobacteraceae bacterium]
MPRAHIEFLQAQQLPWRPAPFPGRDWAGIECKVLSRDPASGACSVLLRLPPGCERGPHAIAAQHEWFVLEGALRIGALEFGLDDYACWAAGRSRESLASPRGAVLLSFFDREPAWQVLEAGSVAARRAPTEVDAALDATQGLVERIATHEMPWTSHDIDPSVQFLRLSHKVLRQVPSSGERTVLLSMGAQAHPAGWQEAQLRHDCVEEMYLLGGDIIGERGTMYEGAYFWRPPGQWHGPFGTRRGSLSLIRFSDGRHQNIWGDEVLRFTLEPAHAPELPPELRSVAGTPWSPPHF